MAHGGASTGHHKANERRFDKHIIKVDSRPIGVRRLRCITVDCGFEGEVIDRTTDGLPPSVTTRKFEQKGWTVGKDEKGDFCPACTDKHTAERRLRRAPRATNLKIVTTEGESPMSAIHAEAPRIMSRDDRRLIFAKLSDVYVDEKTGYSTPWTDPAVAKDLGVPVAWVVEIREENFGPAHDNQEIRDMLARVHIAAGDANAVLAEAKAIRAEGAALVERINGLNRQATDIGHTLSGLLTLADRIQKAVT